VVDWSGRKSNESDAIWLAECIDGELIRLESGRTRVEVVDELVRTITEHSAAAQSVLIGLDFSFSFPAWFVQSLGCHTQLDLWTTVATHGETWLQQCEPPFWGRPGKPRPSETESRHQFRRTEVQTQSVSGIRPKSTFQIGGAGSVGTGSIRGMPHLVTLQEAGAAIWPFDQPGDITVCEVYPRLWTGPVVKSSPDARRQYLTEYQITPPAAALTSEDAFDAFVSALMISRLASGPPRITLDAEQQLEGMIYDPGHQ
jgi:Protein of unknown function (DUF429)